MGDFDSQEDSHDMEVEEPTTSAASNPVITAASSSDSDSDKVIDDLLSSMLNSKHLIST